MQGGTRGLQGIQGVPGKDGNDYDVQIGNTTTLPPGSDATATTNKDEELNILYLNLGIPEGLKGDKGDKGDTNITSFDIIDGKLIAYNDDSEPIVMGTVAMVPKGEYDSSAYYEYLNVVTYNGDTYIAKKASNNVLPTDTEYWQYIAGGVTYQDIVDNLESTATNKILSAKQGKILDAKKPTIYENVADMEADDTLKNGMTVQTLGYYLANDGGGATYKITNTPSLVDYQETLNNALYATLIDTVEMNIKQFGAKGDSVNDDTQAIQNAIDYCFNKGLDLKVPSTLNYYKITSPLILKTAQGDLGDTYWAGNGTRLFGDYKTKSKIVKIGNTTTEIDSNNINSTLICWDNNTGLCIENLTIANYATSELNSFDNGSYAIYTNRSRSNFKDLNIIAYYGIYAKVFSTNFENIVFNCTEKALEVNNGTSNTFRFMYAPGCLNPYSIVSSYSTLINCASDNCRGTIYKLAGMGLTLFNCGCESKNAQYIFEQANNSTFTNVTIQGMMIDRQIGDSENNLDIGDCAVFHITNSCSIKLRDISIIERDLITDGNSYVFKLDEDGVRANTVVDNLSYYKNYTGSNNTRMKLWNGYRTEGYTPHTYSSGGLTMNYQLIGEGKMLPFIGGFQGALSGEINSNSLIDDNLKNKAIYFDTEGRYTSSGNTSFQYIARPNLGDLHIYNDPLTKNAFGNVVTSITNNSNFSINRVPLVIARTTAERPTSNLYSGLCIYDTTLHKPVWYDETTSKWYDASGTQA